MRIIRAEHLGMCFGVRDAIALALEQAATEPLTVLGDLVHNETVLAELRARGIKIAQHPAAVDTADGDDHRAWRLRKRRWSGRASAGCRCIEATCPLVHVAHRAVANWCGRGSTPSSSASAIMSKCAV